MKKLFSNMKEDTTWTNDSCSNKLVSITNEKNLEATT